MREAVLDRVGARGTVLLGHEGVAQVHLEVGRVGEDVVQFHPIEVLVRVRVAQVGISLNREAEGGAARALGVEGVLRPGLEGWCPGLSIAQAVDVARVGLEPRDLQGDRGTDGERGGDRLARVLTLGGLVFDVGFHRPVRDGADGHRRVGGSPEEFRGGEGHGAERNPREREAHEGQGRHEEAAHSAHGALPHRVKVTGAEVPPSGFTTTTCTGTPAGTKALSASPLLATTLVPLT